MLNRGDLVAGTSMTDSEEKLPINITGLSTSSKQVLEFVFAKAAPSNRSRYYCIHRALEVVVFTSGSAHPVLSGSTS